jgi:hypothetical protein
MACAFHKMHYHVSTLLFIIRNTIGYNKVEFLFFYSVFWLAKKPFSVFRAEAEKKPPDRCRGALVLIVLR